MIRFFLVFSCLFFAWTSNGHPVSLNWVHLKIEENQIKVSYRILAEDLIYFYRPEPDDFYNYPTHELLKLAEEHSRLISESFKIQDQNGLLTPLELPSLRTGSMKENQINVMDLMKHEIIYHFTMGSLSEGWEYLTLEQGLGKGAVKIPVVTFLSAEENGRSLMEESELSDDAPFKMFRFGENKTGNPSELTSSFFTSTNVGIKHELTMSKDLLNSLMGKSRGNTITKEQLLSYFKRYNKVSIQGNQLGPSLDKISLLSVNNGQDEFIYMDLNYRFNTIPKELSIEWNDYNWDFRWLESTISIGDSVFNHTFSRFQPNFQWVAPQTPERN